MRIMGVRLTGREFAALLDDDAEPAEAARHLADRLAVVFDEPYEVRLDLDPDTLQLTGNGVVVAEDWRVLGRVTIDSLPVGRAA